MTVMPHNLEPANVLKEPTESIWHRVPSGASGRRHASALLASLNRRPSSNAIEKRARSGAEATNPLVVDNVNPCAIGLMGPIRPVGHIQRPHAAA